MSLVCLNARAAEKRGYDFGVWQPVPKGFNWVHRRNGITHYWSPSLGVWKHYNLSSLLDNPIEPEAWTQGRMVKNWILLNTTAFELWSLYEPSSVGHWPVSRAARIDGLLEAHHVYVKTPFRITQLPGVYLPASVDFPEGHDSSRVTIVQADAATYSGPRWLPTSQEAEILQYLQDQGDDKFFYRRWSFSEMWLSDTVHGCKEGRKMGLFVQYHGMTGELLQLICMRERSMMPTTSPEALVYYNPDVDCDLDRMEQELTKLNDKTERAVLKSPASRALANGEPIEHVLELGAWDNFNARIVQCKGLLGPETACVVKDRLADELVYASPYLNDPDLYLDLRWKDGMYARIPKRLVPEMDDICLEIGGLTCKGDFHRLMAVGSRREGSIHTTVYERWSKKESTQPVPSFWGADRQGQAERGASDARDKSQRGQYRR
ncbi:hypothetical protein MPSEU_000855100 [Mayamaea pseudoterrestris]|nr:hypothetical protein MPSEU_000855100 [Mayamaea pseudoterrestris]